MAKFTWTDAKLSLLLWRYSFIQNVSNDHEIDDYSRSPFYIFYRIFQSFLIIVGTKI